MGLTNFVVILSTAAATLAADGQELSHDQVKARSHFGLATRAYRLGEFEESLENCVTALRFDPKYQNALELHAFSAIALRDYAQAKESLELALAREPEDRKLFQSLVRTYSHLGLWQQALDLLDQTSAELSLEMRQDRVVILIRLKRLSEAEDQLDQIFDPNRHETVRLRVELAALKSDWNTAVATLDAFPGTAESSSLTLALAACLVKMEQPDRAAEEMEERLGQDPTHLPLRRRLIELYAGPLDDRKRADLHRARLRRLLEDR